MDTQAQDVTKFEASLSLLRADLGDITEHLGRWKAYSDELREACRYDWEYAIDGWLGGVLRSVEGGSASAQELRDFDRFRSELDSLAPAMKAHGFTVPDLSKVTQPHLAVAA